MAPDDYLWNLRAARYLTWVLWCTVAAKVLTASLWVAAPTVVYAIAPDATWSMFSVVIRSISIPFVIVVVVAVWRFVGLLPQEVRGGNIWLTPLQE